MANQRPTRRDADPEDYVNDRDETEVLHRESDRRGTRAERQLEDRVYGDDR